ncbi:MAG: hypothetical protein KBC84_06710 [Proteobacteria bacterium]|nr:hypothetical protein [Pseudomonadota bacterium]
MALANKTQNNNNHTDVELYAISSDAKLPHVGQLDIQLSEKKLQNENSLARLPELNMGLGNEMAKKSCSKIASFVQQTVRGLVEGVRYLSYVPESLLLVVANAALYLFADVKTRGNVVNSIRGVFNKLSPWGSLLGEDAQFAVCSDEKLKEIVNPLNNLSKGLVEPLTKPLHEVSQGITDSVSFVAYNLYRHYSLNQSAISYQDFQIELENEKNWQLRMGRSALYTVEALALAYYMGASSAASRAQSIKRMFEILGMPIVMTSLQAVGGILKREDFSSLSASDVCAELITQLPKGVFDSSVFMLPIAKISEFAILKGADRLNFKYSSGNGYTLSQYQRDMNLLVARVRSWGEYLDLAEGLPGAYEQTLELKNKTREILGSDDTDYSRWRALAGVGLEFISSALDLVDHKHNVGFQKNINAVSESAQMKVDSSLKGQVVELENIAEVQEYYCEYLFRIARLRGVDSVWQFLGYAEAASNSNIDGLIVENSKTIQAFYDKERDVIFVGKLAADASKIEIDKHQGIVAHENFHRRVAKAQGGLSEVLANSPEVVKFVSEIIMPIHNQRSSDFAVLHYTEIPPLLLEEYAAVAEQILCLEESEVQEAYFDDLILTAVEMGVSNYSDAVVGSSLSNGVVEILPFATHLQMPRDDNGALSWSAFSSRLVEASGMDSFTAMPWIMERIYNSLRQAQQGATSKQFKLVCRGQDIIGFITIIADERGYKTTAYHPFSAIGGVVTTDSFLELLRFESLSKFTARVGGPSEAHPTSIGVIKTFSSPDKTQEVLYLQGSFSMGNYQNYLIAVEGVVFLQALAVLKDFANQPNYWTVFNQNQSPEIIALNKLIDNLIKKVPDSESLEVEDRGRAMQLLRELKNIVNQKNWKALKKFKFKPMENYVLEYQLVARIAKSSWRSVGPLEIAKRNCSELSRGLSHFYAEDTNYQAANRMYKKYNRSWVEILAQLLFVGGARKILLNEEFFTAARKFGVEVRMATGMLTASDRANLEILNKVASQHGYQLSEDEVDEICFVKVGQ